MKSTHQTDEAINTEIAKLKEMKPRVRKFNAFGDNNHEAVDAQIAVLTERMTIDEVHNRFEDAEDPEENHNELDSALAAHDWMTGASDEESPSEGWANLVQ